MNENVIKENKVMKVAVIVSWVLVALMYVWYFNYAVSQYDLDTGSFRENVKNIAEVFVLFVLLGGVPYGFVRTSNFRKKFSNLLYIPVLGWIIWLYAQLIPPVFAGGILLIIDTIKMIFRKPIVK